MPYSLYDPTIEVVKPKFWIARPNKQIVTRVKELDELVTFHPTLGGINEISGEIPYLLNRNGKTIKNPHIKYIKNKYLIKMEFMDNTEWFVIEDVSKNGNEEKDTVSFTAYNLAYNLRGKKLYNDKFEGKTPREVMDELLSGTSWATGRISTIIGGKIRSFDEFSPNTNIIEAINTISESYAGIPSYDSNDKLINLLHKDDYAIVSNLMINDKNYIQSYQKDSNTDDIVTRLFATGEDGLSIAGITPTGKMYIDKFDYFMYPFKRDENKNVLSHSDFMSDELCHAILDQQEAIETIAPLVKEKQDDIDELTDSLTSLEDTEDEMRLKYETVEGILDFMRANEEYYYGDFLSSGSTYSFTFRQGYFIGQARAKNSSSSAQLSFGGTVRNLTNEWTTFKYDKTGLDPLGDGELMTVTSLTNDNCEFYIVRVPKEEYDSYTDEQVKEKYNGLYWKDEYESAQNGYEAKQNEIDRLQSELEELYKSVGDDNFYTLDLLREKDEFIHVYYWEEPTHTDAQELYDDAVEKLNELHKPKLSIETDIFNFLASLDDKRNWKKLILGSRVRVKHSRLDEYNEVILTGIEYDFANETIKLALEDVKDLSEDTTWSMIMQGANASSTLNLNKKLWDDNVAKSKTFDEILNSEYDATKRRILAGVNESVEISNRGLRIINPDYPKQMLIGTAGVLALSKSGGQTFETAISPDGIHADKIIGRMIVGQKLLIRNDEGTVTIDGATVSVKDRSDNVKVKLGEYEKDKFGLQVLDGAVTIRTKGTTGNTGLILDKDGIRSYDTNGKQTFNIDGNTGSATFSGTVNAGTIIGSTINGGTISGTTITGSTISSSNGSLTTQMTGGKLQFYNNGEDYGSLTPQLLNLKYTEYGTVGSYSAVTQRASSLNGTQLSLTFNRSLSSGSVQNQSVYLSALGMSFTDNDGSGNAFTVNGDRWDFSNSQVNFLSSTPVNIYSSLNLNGYPVATQNYVQSQLSNYWVRGSSSGALSSNVYVTANTISVGGSWIGDSSTPYTNIGTNNIYIPGKYYAGGSAVTSDRNKKKNIIPYDKDVLEQIVDTQVYTYNLKTELDSEFPHLGIMLQEAPVDVVDPEGGVELYAMISFVWKAIQELYKKDEGYRERVEILESLTNQQTDTLNELLSNLQGVSCQLNN